MSADTKIKLCLWESRDRQNIKLARPSFILSLCSLPLKTLAEFCLMNQSIRWRLWLVNISGQLWPICGIQVLLIGQGSSQHISAILDYAHDLLSVVNGWALSTPQKSNALTLPLDRLLRYQVASSKNSEMYLFLACTVTQPRRNEKIIWKTMQWIKSRNCDVIGD